MALSDATLKTNLLNLFNQMKESPMSEEDYADKLAKIIDAQIKTAMITVDAGISVTVTTPAGPGQGATSAPGTGSLS
ncbi:MAG: hypothetical protein Ta2A_12490 [Treponemataceae bacterium]|nr:MAG: hypothetical protein Ta2A_12490 [Treponemataceae bacterium]